jgi:hypothetical protein
MGPVHHHLRQQQQVLITHEWRSTKLCCCCFSPVRYMRRRVDGHLKDIRGAVQCPNPQCALYGRTLSRDHNAGTCDCNNVVLCAILISFLSFFLSFYTVAATNIGYITLGQLLHHPLPCFINSGNTTLGALGPTPLTLPLRSPTVATCASRS